MMFEPYYAKVSNRYKLCKIYEHCNKYKQYRDFKDIKDQTCFFKLRLEVVNYISMYLL